MTPFELVQSISNKFGCVYAVMVFKQGLKLMEMGSVIDLDHREVVDEYFLKNPEGVFGVVEGMHMPQIASQGRTVIVMCNPREEVVVGFATNRNDNVVDYYPWAEEINKQLLEKWK